MRDFTVFPSENLSWLNGLWFHIKIWSGFEAERILTGVKKLFTVSDNIVYVRKSVVGVYLNAFLGVRFIVYQTRIYW